MKNQNESQEKINETAHMNVDPQQLISVNKFALLCFLSFGLYELWWIYKAWRFFQQKEKYDIMPALRALLSIFFLHLLFNEIREFAVKKGYNKHFSAAGLFIGFLVLNLGNGLPGPFFLISVFSFIFLIPPFKALNFAKQSSTEFIVIEQNSFSGRQIVLIIIGIMGWGIFFSAFL
jgi:hypothetical protein